MKFLWLLAVALCAFLFVKAIDAEQHNVDSLKIVEDKNFESKLLHEVDDKGADETLDDENTADEEGSIFPELITDKDVEQLNEPGMQRLARHLKSFHNYNLQRSNNNLGYTDDEVDDVAPEERAIRRRQRVRRRNTKNKIKRVNNNRQVANRSKVSRRRMQDNNSVRRRNTKKSNIKNTKNTRRNNTRRSIAKRAKRNHRNHKRGNFRNSNVKRNRSNKTRRNRGQQKLRRSKYEQMMYNHDKNLNESDMKPQDLEKETASGMASDAPA